MQWTGPVVELWNILMEDRIANTVCKKKEKKKKIKGPNWWSFFPAPIWTANWKFNTISQRICEPIVGANCENKFQSNQNKARGVFKGLDPASSVEWRCAVHYGLEELFTDKQSALWSNLIRCLHETAWTLGHHYIYLPLKDEAHKYTVS